ncbi:hypothetical protein [Capnocytophaga catalasegens]|uniref:Uncharacterized protein n=1 Tax=Capnocytophaga catalasegens TaxID=1004260 RepID=A0AAV5AVM7_9FLAO|nr:hypothetical protein [Capnocytophaga catalasegens]GIZ15548.1 hypothetical protein RCZ03_15480 [Capnocytophaga catalasegens]GJM49891.1 hypothetical protein RCZ15_08660 [Capnocytophaga catalasegens]GJM54063.1 hypothetical protein RCZ16_23790 [Capnocytophaga catalasegens]
MFEESYIIYFTPFFFKNGNTSKNKYFVVLKNNQGKGIIASLPTRKDFVPTNVATEFGCVEIPEANFNCFVISQNIEVTECGKSFDFPTFLYGHLIDEYNIQKMQEIYPNQGTDYVVWGKMKADLFNNLIDCLKKSKSVKNKFKKMFEINRKN